MNTRLPVRYVLSTEREYQGSRAWLAPSDAAPARSPARRGPASTPVAAATSAMNARVACTPMGTVRTSGMPKLFSSHRAAASATSGYSTTVASASGSRRSCATVAPSGAHTCTSIPSCPSSPVTSRTSSRLRNPRLVAPSRFTRGRRPSRAQVSATGARGALPGAGTSGARSARTSW
jgi:hypothetical protein